MTPRGGGRLGQGGERVAAGRVVTVNTAANTCSARMDRKHISLQHESPHSRSHSISVLVFNDGDSDSASQNEACAVLHEGEGGFLF